MNKEHLVAENCGLRNGYKQTEVGVIPADWDVSSVGNSFDVCNQLRLPISQAIRERMIGTYPYYGPTGIQGWINEYRVEGSYALIGEDGDHFLKWRTQSMTLMVQGKFNVNNHAHLVKGSKNLTDWFYWFFSNRDITNHLTRQGAGRYKLSKSTLINLPCSLPPLSEQRAITTVLSDVDALLAKLNQLITKKRDLKQASMQKLLTGQTRLSGFSMEWEIKRVIEMGEIVTGGTPRTDIKYFWGDCYPWITPTDITSCRDMYASERSLTLKGLNAIRLLPANTVLVTCIASIGKNAILKTKGGCNQQINAVIPNKNNSAEFLYYLFEASKQYLLANAGITATSIVSKAVFGELCFLVPSSNEQIAIATVLSDIDTEITALETRRDKTRDLKQGMMQELLTGRIRLI
jgi:type I restriction enzyme S subunit